MTNTNKFLKDLKWLLERYKCEIVAVDEWMGYPECGQDIQITFEFDDYNQKDIKFGERVYCEKLDKMIKA
jgi:hypothetical protein